MVVVATGTLGPDGFRCKMLPFSIKFNTRKLPIKFLTAYVNSVNAFEWRVGDVFWSTKSLQFSGLCWTELANGEFEVMLNFRPLENNEREIVPYVPFDFNAFELVDYEIVYPGQTPDVEKNA